MPKKIVGIVENVTLIGEKKVSTYALFDTGAKLTSIDIKLAGKAKLGPIIRTTRVKSASTRVRSSRPVVKIKLNVKGKELECEANLQDRSHMSFPMIIGRNIIEGRFIVDPAKNKKLFKRMFREKNSARAQGIYEIDYFANGSRE